MIFLMIWRNFFKNADVSDFSKVTGRKSCKSKVCVVCLGISICILRLQRFKALSGSRSNMNLKIEDGNKKTHIAVNFDEKVYLVLAQRYKELSDGGGGTKDNEDIPYDLVGYLTEIDTGRIDSDYMNSRFEKYLKLIKQDGVPGELIEQAKSELHKTFAALTQEEQKYANIFLHDTERGDVIPEPGKTLRDYITEYQYRAKNDQIHRFAHAFGMDEEKLRNMMSLGLTETNINEFGRFDELRKSLIRQKLKNFWNHMSTQSLFRQKLI